MKQGQAAAIQRLDYSAPAYWIDTVELTFDLDPAKTRVLNTLRMSRSRDVRAQALRLDGEGLNLARVLVNGSGTSFKLEGEQLVLENLPEGPEPFELEIFTTCQPAKNTQLSGLYVSQGTFFTQCEAQGFRRITYFLDRPDVMASYSVLLRADKAQYPVLLSNGNLVESGDLGEGRHFARWQDPHKKPCYLFALVAGKVGAPGRPGKNRIRHACADARHRLGRGALWPAVGSGALHDRRHQRLQHGRHGKQGPEHLQHQVRAGQPVHGHRRGLCQRRVGDWPRVLPQLDGQPHHLPRLVPALAQGRPDGVPRPRVQHGHGRHALGACRQAHRRCARLAHRPVP